MKLKRLLTAALSAVMALSVCAMPAMADDVTRIATLPDLSAGKTGSITVHKYEYNGKDGVDGTGEATDTDKVPEDANGLNGAKFAVYRVMDGTQLEAYYKGLQDGTVAQAKIETYVDMTTYEIRSDYASKQQGGEVETKNVGGNDGIAEFKDLPVGLYAVIETYAPDGVTQKVTPFLVSIPMTDTSGENWLYDVNVFPKNKTAYTGIQLVKLGKTGGENATATELTGFTFELQKWDGTKWIEITNEASAGVDNASNVALDLTTNNGKINVNNLTQGIYRFKETAGPDKGAQSGYIVDKDTYYAFEISKDESTGALKANAVTDQNDAAFTAEHEKYNFASVKNYGGETTLSVVVDNYKPDFKKEVKDRTNDTYGQDADYSVGDNVPYKLTVTVPQNIANLKTFYVTDTPDSKDHLEFVADSIVITGLTENTDYKVTPDTANGGFKIDFKDASLNGKGIENFAGQELTITYKYKLLDGAVKTDVGNVNTAKLVYSHNVDTSEGATDEPYEIEDRGVVYTFKTNILKKGDDGELLEKVAFDLYKDVQGENTTGKTPLTKDEAEKLKLPVNNGQQWYKVAPKETGSDGKLAFEGLSNGTYYLVETKTKSGYNLLSEPVKVELTIDHTTTWTTKDSYGTDGKLIKHEGNSTTFTGTGTGSVDGYYETTIINRKGFTLPRTGGFGTLLFSGIGVLLVLAGVSVLFSLKKKNTRA